MCLLSEYILDQLPMKLRAEQKIVSDHEIYSLYAKGGTQGLETKN